MRVSAKAKYGLAAMICLAQKYNSNGEYITVLSLAERLKISKIYLEQVFALLKRAGLVLSIKGARGGYQLSRAPKDITAFDIVSSIEISLFEKNSDSFLDGEESIEKTIHASVLERLDNSIHSSLSEISLESLALDVQKRSSENGYMFYL
ncbi:MAG: Rrf2 family transcriptional regulator [Endomicrobium sp.]|jgi:Rrf2 family protein|nr:Rrf2 family transcriptional regulator [Endomicrobium sp.]